MQDPVIRSALVNHAPWPLGLDHNGQEIFVRFINHDDGEGYRALQGHRTGWLMFLGVPLDYRNEEILSEVVGTFGQFHYWNHEDDRLVRSLVYASFPDNLLVPRDVVFRKFANVGGVVVSWTASCSILTATFAEQLPRDEDVMPVDGNPHPMPGHLQPAENFWAVPPYPALGWNDIPQPDDPQQQQPQQDGWGAWNEPVEEQAGEQPQVQQDQASMVLNPSMGSNDSSQQNLVVDGPPLNPFQGIVPVLEGDGPIGPIIQEEADGANVEIGPLQPLNMPEDDILVQELDNEVQAEV